MPAFSRSRELAAVALGALLITFACMPGRVEVGRDSTLDAPVAGEAGMLGSGGAAARGSGGASNAEGGEAAGGATAHAGTGADGGALSVGRGSGGASSSGASSSGGSSVAAGAGATIGTGGGIGSGGTTGMPFVCPPEGSHADTLWPLDNFCRTFGCPSSVDDAKVLLLNQHPDCSGLRADVSDGCGYVQVGMSGASTGDVYVFEGSPPALVGAGIHRDTPWGPCNGFRYVGGVMPAPCDATTLCTFCGPEATCPP